MRIMNNISAMNAHRLYTANNSKLSKSLEKLSSGYAINRAGDNAAGLAVSEKMRAQIAGLEQASKNAQDGISMVQTYEGALTETDSILQRMRSLAVQSANGTYDNSVDRVAIEQEFKQLNDELDQIADTDFNGVVVLNGGVMADGLKAVDGVFDYANKDDQIIAKATEMAQAAVNTAKSEMDKANALKASSKYDLSNNGTAQEWNTVDDLAYTKDAADTLWVDLGYTTTEGGDTADTSVITSVDVTFEYDKEAGTWTAIKGTDNSGAGLTEDQLSKFSAESVPTSVGDATGTGGVKVTAGGVDVNAVFDTTEAKTGDTVTLTFVNSDSANKAPTNAGVVDASFTGLDNLTGKVADSAIAAPEIDLNETNLTDEKMTEDIYKILSYLDGATVTQTVTNSAYSAPAANTPVTIGNTSITGTGKAFTLTDEDGNAIKGEDGNDLQIWVVNNTGNLTISTVANAKAGTELLTLKAGALTAGTNGKLAGTVSYGIAIEKFEYSDTAIKPNVMVGDDKALGTSNDAQAAADAAEAKYNAALAKQASLQDYEAAKAYLAEAGVSMPNAYDQSTAKLTYNNGMSLQVGARTKDLVDFTFQYDAEALGELDADLNCTAKGLGTDELSLATQESANKAIDKIDHAINKISMVRGTFGAIQNRLEHKINNLDTNHENLSAAESRIRDTDMAAEMMEFTKNQILSQASQSMLAQANQLPQGVLSLLQ